MNSKIPAFVSSLSLTIIVADDTVRKTHLDQIVQDDKKNIHETVYKYVSRSQSFYRFVYLKVIHRKIYLFVDFKVSTNVGV